MASSKKKAKAAEEGQAPKYVVLRGHMGNLDRGDVASAEQLPVAALMQVEGGDPVWESPPEDVAALLAEGSIRLATSEEAEKGERVVVPFEETPEAAELKSASEGEGEQPISTPSTPDTSGGGSGESS
jgi:hypothetical protein